MTGGNDEESRKHRKLAKEIVLGLNNGMTQYGIHHQLTEKGFSGRPEFGRDIRPQVF